MKALQPVSTEGCHGPILCNDTQWGQAMPGPYLSIYWTVSRSHLHCPCAHMWLNSGVCDEGEKLSCQRMTELSPM